MKAKIQSLVATAVMITLVTIMFWFLFQNYQKNGNISAGSHNSGFVSQN